VGIELEEIWIRKMEQKISGTNRTFIVFFALAVIFTLQYTPVKAVQFDEGVKESITSYFQHESQQLYKTIEFAYQLFLGDPTNYYAATSDDDTGNFNRRKRSLSKDNDELIQEPENNFEKRLTAQEDNSTCSNVGIQVYAEKTINTCKGQVCTLYEVSCALTYHSFLLIVTLM
jgi:hypothetical protein